MSFLENNFFLLAYYLRDFLLCQTASEENRTGIIKSYIADHRTINHLP